MKTFKEFFIECLCSQDDQEYLEEKNKPTSPEKWARAKAAAKSKFAVYPSAYANAWASKKYKSMGGGWKSVSEEVEQIDEASTYKLGRAAAETKDFPIHHNGEHVGRLQFHASGGKLYHRVSSVAGVPHEKFIGHPDREKMTNSHVQKHEAEARKHFAKKIKEEVELDEVAAWQRKEGKSESGGLNQKGVESYRRENPGSKLQTAVTTKPSKLKPGSKSANRRKSFCARMSGMKKRLTSAKTARDPNSRINKSLRKWNC